MNALGVESFFKGVSDARGGYGLDEGAATGCGSGSGGFEVCSTRVGVSGNEGGAKTRRERDLDGVGFDSPGARLLGGGGGGLLGFGVSGRLPNAGLKSEKACFFADTGSITELNEGFDFGVRCGSFDDTVENTDLKVETAATPDIGPSVRLRLAGASSGKTKDSNLLSKSSYKLPNMVLTLPLELFRYIASFVRDPDPPLFHTVIFDPDWGYTDTPRSFLKYNGGTRDLLNLTLVSKAVRAELNSIFWSHVLIDLNEDSSSTTSAQSKLIRIAQKYSSLVFTLVLRHPVYDVDDPSYTRRILDPLAQLFSKLTVLQTLDLMSTPLALPHAHTVPPNHFPSLTTFRFSGAIERPDLHCDFLARHPALTDVTFAPSATLDEYYPDPALVWRELQEKRGLSSLRNLHFSGCAYPPYLPRSLVKLTIHHVADIGSRERLLHWLVHIRNEEPFYNLRHLSLYEDPEVSLEAEAPDLIQTCFPNLVSLKGTNLPYWLIVRPLPNLSTVSHISSGTPHAKSTLAKPYLRDKLSPHIKDTSKCGMWHSQHYEF
ncbi:hypothetical protein SISNIDRAFT_494408 [Sistotremastrum niveocremeum HHB9708]|uniref:Uncharacterized protein n=1 Tax=Sistotremastrum niveocremeum HHB9708 TaxID=1314777 RepID=A0A164X004_9AGAM|nr:hypothetical protein SISNIDRAFT_494408 [Sistotremastrum niveocremeum HHB9708]